MAVLLFTQLLCVKFNPGSFLKCIMKLCRIMMKTKI